VTEKEKEKETGVKKKDLKRRKEGRPDYDIRRESAPAGTRIKGGKEHLSRGEGHLASKEVKLAVVAVKEIPLRGAVAVGGGERTAPRKKKRGFG